MASIFIDGLIHVVDNPKDMITRRTNPSPEPKTESNVNKIENAIEKIKDWF